MKSRAIILTSVGSLALLAMLLHGATVAMAAEHSFHSDATTVLVEVQGSHRTTMGSGQATDLGSFTEVHHFKAKGNDYEGTATLTGANNDSLVLATAFSLVGDHYEGTYQIIGGTGRFEDAAGAGTLRGDPNPDGSFHQVLDGTISF
jgi:hypothetical protein